MTGSLDRRAGTETALSGIATSTSTVSAASMRARVLTPREAETSEPYTGSAMLKDWHDECSPSTHFGHRLRVSIRYADFALRSLPKAGDRATIPPGWIPAIAGLTEFRLGRHRSDEPRLGVLD